jgi:cysteine synthase A
MSPTLPEGNRYLNRLAATPLVPVRLGPGQPEVWCKLELLNPSGSTKDRVARFILEKAWRQGRLRAGDLVVEASSGSTSIALALACAQMGLRFLAVMPEGVSGERVLIIRAYGGSVKLTPAAGGIRGAIAAAEELGREAGVFLPRQFANADNAEAHRLGTAREMVDQLPGGCADGVVSGVGTGGTLMGLFQGLRECGCPVRPFLARPVDLTTTPEAECCSFSSRIPGVADSLSSIFRAEELPGLEVLEIEGAAALETTRRLIALGFPVGPSSGLNYRAALEARRRLGGDARVVTVFPDRMERYFTTELFRPFAEPGPS